MSIDTSHVETHFPTLVLEYLKANESQVRPDVEVTMFENGRESGFTLKTGSREITFANARSSDSLVVYPFVWEDPDQVRREKNYFEKRQYFNPGKVSVAGEFIIGYLNGKRLRKAAA